MMNNYKKGSCFVLTRLAFIHNLSNPPKGNTRAPAGKATCQAKMFVNMKHGLHYNRTIKTLRNLIRWYLLSI